MMNSNDIFAQIGFIVSPKKNKNNAHQLSFNEKPRYSTFLEIELGENEKHLLQVKDTDHPHHLATQFCHQHRLNRLAVSIVEQKIREAQQIQEAKLEHEHRFASKSPSRDKSANQNQKHRKNNSPKKREKQEGFKKSNSPTPNKNKNKGRREGEEGKNRKNDNIYMRGLVKTRMLEEQRSRKKVQMEQKEQDGLTFKPQINKVSEKIVQFLKETNVKKQKKPSPPKKMYDELKECTFKPKINKASERIYNNRNALKEERERQRHLMYDSNSDQNYSKTASQITADDQQMFRPKINPKSSQKITMPFFKRLEIEMEKKKNDKSTKQELKIFSKSHIEEESECSFQPKIGRAPRIHRNKENVPIWEHLYQQSRKEHECKSRGKDTQLTRQTTSTQKISSQNYYENLVEERIRETFNVLDSDGDGAISPDHIQIESLTPPSLIFLKPILLEMDEINAHLNFHQFRRAVTMLMMDSDPGTKGAFISERWKKQQSLETNFKPKINKRSKELAGNRSMASLYRDGVKQKQSREYKLERERALKEERELAQCSFKPVLNYSSKKIMEKITKKKEGKSIDQMFESFNKDQSEDNSSFNNFMH